MRSTRSRGLKGLVRYSLAPVSRPVMRASSLFHAVSMMMGMGAVEGR